MTTLIILLVVVLVIETATLCAAVASAKAFLGALAALKGALDRLRQDQPRR